MLGEAAIPHPSLRLARRPLRVEAPGQDHPDAWRAEARARLAVADENQSASALEPDAARRMLAMRVAECLEGGRAAILTPARRRRIMRLAHMLGVREFDANLVIAIVQDGARRGEAPAEAPRDDRLALFPGGLIVVDSSRRRLAAALALGAGVLVALLAWFFAP